MDRTQVPIHYTIIGIASDRPKIRFGQTSAELSDKQWVQKFLTNKKVRPNRTFGRSLTIRGGIFDVFTYRIFFLFHNLNVPCSFNSKFKYICAYFIKKYCIVSTFNYQEIFENENQKQLGINWGFGSAELSQNFLTKNGRNFGSVGFWQCQSSVYHYK